MDAIRSTGLWVTTFVVAMSCALSWPSTEYKSVLGTLEIPRAQPERGGFPRIHQLAALQRALEELDRRVDAALHEHSQCEGMRDRVRLATVRLEELRRDKAAVERRIAEARLLARLQGNVVSADCRDNPRANGCL